MRSVFVCGTCKSPRSRLSRTNCTFFLCPHIVRLRCPKHLFLAPSASLLWHEPKGFPFLTLADSTVMCGHTIQCSTLSSISPYVTILSSPTKTCSFATALLKISILVLPTLSTLPRSLVTLLFSRLASRNLSATSRSVLNVVGNSSPSAPNSTSKLHYSKVG